MIEEALIGMVGMVWGCVLTLIAVDINQKRNEKRRKDREEREDAGEPKGLYRVEFEGRGEIISPVPIVVNRIENGDKTE